MRHISAKVRIGSIAVTLVAIAAMSAPPATADADFDPLPDRGDHTWCFDTDYFPNSIVQERIEWSMGTLESQTIVNAERHPYCTAQTDVRWQQRYIPSGYYGLTNCLDLNSNNRCDQWRVRIDYGLMQDYANTPPGEARHTACHELGHTVGVRHYGQDGVPNPDPSGHSCMRSGDFGDGSTPYHTYGPHHISAHINPDWS